MISVIYREDVEKMICDRHPQTPDDLETEESEDFPDYQMGLPINEKWKIR